MQKLRQRNARGFTLLELLVSVAIVAILAKVAYPIYTQSILKSRRTEAKNALLDLAAREERYFSTANQYTTSASALGYGSAATVTAANPLPVLAGNVAYYNLSVQVPDPNAPAASTAPSFRATATAVGTQVKDTRCGNFTLTQAGVQGMSGTDSVGNCW